ncbi:glycosyltransferase family 2 protein [Mucilaginibacter arboris]|uniref:Glycosyltransferase n=1 Tax=Mucilaginibacter arboris TaxID=2682090 RepID=A0A7K1SY54_9SPHI|nr:glycosyltransferase family 2 protein [Mucilaginibacter arboris]MVN22233.1 glycosyltransferase [Mucilaginibacter arboris]
MQKPLLTIGIPTYNRATYLDRCLNSIITQLEEVKQDIELVIANNASTDHTKNIVDKYSKTVRINYYENTINLGPDSTCSICFDKATGKYVWILGDDEFLLDGSLKVIVDLLKDKDCGDVYMQCIPYHKEEDLEQKRITNAEIISYQNPLEFVKKIHYYVTFISGNIINKSILPIDLDYEKYMGTNIVQVCWTIKAIFGAKENIFIETPLIAAKQNNSGGYQFVNTFAKNYNYILTSLVKEGYHKSIINITNTNIIKNYFPANIIKLLYYENRFDTENHFSVLLKTYWKYKSFWSALFPIYSKYWVKKILGKKMVKLS